MGDWVYAREAGSTDLEETLERILGVAADIGGLDMQTPLGWTDRIGDGDRERPQRAGKGALEHDRVGRAEPGDGVEEGFEGVGAEETFECLRGPCGRYG